MPNKSSATNKFHIDKINNDIKGDADQTLTKNPNNKSGGGKKKANNQRKV